MQPQPNQGYPDPGYAHPPHPAQAAYPQMAPQGATIHTTPSLPFNCPVHIRGFHNTYLRAQPGGENARVDMAARPDAWEKWTLIPVRQDPDGTHIVNVRSSAHGSFLRGNPGGEGSKVDQAAVPRDWEQWRIIQHRGQVAFVNAAHGTCLRSHPGGEGSKVDIQTHPQEWETWSIEPAGGGQNCGMSYDPHHAMMNRPVRLRGFHNTYLRAQPGGENARVDMAVRPDAWEKWTLIPVRQDPDGTHIVNIRSSAHGSFLRGNPGGEGSKVDQAAVPRDWEQWRIVQHRGQVAFVNAAHGTCLRSHPGGEGSKVDIQTRPQEWETWTIEMI